MIKAIIFDCFGVLTTEGWLAFREEYFAKDSVLMERALHLMPQLDAGLITYPQFITEVAQMAEVSESSVRARLDDNVPNEQLLDYIKTDLKPRFSIGMLSNAGDNWLDEMFSADQLSLFDAIALSYETGHLKPYPEAYHTIAGKLGIEPQEGVLVDDQERHCSGASEVGMRAICYKDFKQMKAELETLLNDPKR